MKKRFSLRILADSCSKISRLQTCNPCLPIVNNFVNKAQSFILHYYLRPKEGQVWTTEKALLINISRNNNSGNCKFDVLNYKGNLLQQV